MNDTYIPHSVPLAEVAKLTGRKVAEVEAECRELDVFLGADWAGRPSLAEADAEQLVSGETRRTREDAAEWSAHLALCESWTAARDQALQDAHDAVGADPRSGPQKHSDARDAAVEAGRRFEPPTPFVEAKRRLG